MSREQPIDCDSFEVIDCDADSMSEEESLLNYDKSMYKWYDLGYERLKIDKSFHDCCDFDITDLEDMLYPSEWDEYMKCLAQSFNKYAGYEADEDWNEFEKYQLSVYDMWLWERFKSIGKEPLFP